MIRKIFTKLGELFFPQPTTALEYVRKRGIPAPRDPNAPVGRPGYPTPQPRNN